MFYTSRANLVPICTNDTHVFLRFICTMCLDKKWIYNRYNGQKYFVSCGHCEACQQEKANKRAIRIRNNVSRNDGYNVVLFVTLTYKNDCIPYITLNDLVNAPLVENTGQFPKEVSTLRSVPVYRDSSVRWVRCSRRYRMRRKSILKREQIDEYLFDSALSFHGLKALKNCGSAKYGVSYYPDVQNFFKRLRIILKRRYNYEIPFKYFSCTEYGPATCRPHIHLLLFIPGSRVEMFKCSIATAWSFDDYRRTYNYCEIARDCAGYVSSYVNCDASLPEIFKTSRQASPSHSFSHGFGFALSQFQLPKIIEAYERGDLTYVCQRVKQGTLVNDTVLLPKYTLSRYFPKFKGFTRLSSFEIQSIALRPELFSRYKTRLDLDDEQVHSYFVTLTNKKAYAQSLGIDPYYYSLVYSRIYDLYASQLYRSQFLNVNVSSDNVFAYDNILDYFKADVLSPSLDEVFPYLQSHHLISDPNYFPDNVARHVKYRDIYRRYSKDRKIRNSIYSLNHHF